MQELVEGFLAVIILFIVVGGITALARQVKPWKSLEEPYRDWQITRELRRRASQRRAAASRSGSTLSQDHYSRRQLKRARKWAGTASSSND